MRGGELRFRLLAAVLAVGGVLWGLFCLPIFVNNEHVERPIMVFGPGYVVTIGYICRILWTMDRDLRRLVWGASALVQGAWLCWFLIGILNQGFRGFAFQYLALSWWTFSFLVSAYALIVDVSEEG